MHPTGSWFMVAAGNSAMSDELPAMNYEPLTNNYLNLNTLSILALS